MGESGTFYLGDGSMECEGHYVEFWFFLYNRKPLERGVNRAMTLVIIFGKDELQGWMNYLKTSKAGKPHNCSSK